MKKSIWIGLLLFSTTLVAQENLVENGSFEETSKKVKSLGSLSSAMSWSSPTASKPDLFVSGKNEEIGIPQNIYGTEEAKDGQNYAGIVAFSYGDKVPRTYLMTRLSAPLKKGTKYCIQYSLSLAEGSKYACGNMGVLLSKKEYGMDAKSSLIEKPQLMSDKVYSAQFGWDKVCGIYIAEGGEKFLTLGNFSSNEDTKNEKNKTPKGVQAEAIIAAYYYIDDVSIVELVGDARCDCATSDPEEEYSTVIYQKQFVLNDKMTPKEIIQGQELFFAFGSDRLTPLAKEALDMVVQQLTTNKAFKLQVNGHSDKVEDEVGLKKADYSDMSNKRIAAVMEYLAEKGIGTDRIIPSSQGSETPNPEIKVYDDEEMAQAKNRRVAFVVR